jgi:hypothetical protein
LVVLDGPLDDHDRIVQTSFDFRDKLFSPTSEHQRTGLRVFAALEDVIPFGADLAFLEALA